MSLLTAVVEKEIRDLKRSLDLFIAPEFERVEKQWASLNLKYE